MHALYICNEQRRLPLLKTKEDSLENSLHYLKEIIYKEKI
jgi:hypothetical protein